jgi:hypothetical protein
MLSTRPLARKQLVLEVEALNERAHQVGVAARDLAADHFEVLHRRELAVLRARQRLRGGGAELPAIANFTFSTSAGSTCPRCRALTRSDVPLVSDVFTSMRPVDARAADQLEAGTQRHSVMR